MLLTRRFVLTGHRTYLGVQEETWRPPWQGGCPVCNCSLTLIQFYFTLLMRCMFIICALPSNRAVLFSNTYRNSWIRFYIHVFLCRPCVWQQGCWGRCPCLYVPGHHRPVSSPASSSLRISTVLLQPLSVLLSRVQCGRHHATTYCRGKEWRNRNMRAVHLSN